MPDTLEAPREHGQISDFCSPPHLGKIIGYSLRPVMASTWNLAAITLAPTTTLDQAVHCMAGAALQGGPSGLVVIIQDDRVIGVITDGDVRRAYVKGIPFDSPVTKVMSQDPIAVLPGLTAREVIQQALAQARTKARYRDLRIDKVLVLDQERHLVDVLSFLELYLAGDVRAKKVAVYGLGYVGLTLALSLANSGFQVTGVDINHQTIQHLLAGVPPVYEPGLPELLVNHLKSGDIHFKTDLTSGDHDLYIVAVGTPVDQNNQPTLGMIEQVARAIGTLLKRGDLIALRSTVPLGTTRQVFLPLVEQYSGLVGGRDFHVVFTPERTIEGNALQELRTLPQIIGGLTAQCVDQASNFWSTLTPAVVRVQSLEAAELVKLANNTFRDLSFAFANELAWLCEDYNIDAFNLIQAANEGYPRNPIPKPSPGVGGYCLTKDPYIYTAPLLQRQGQGYRPLLGEVSRKVHSFAPDVLLRHLEHFSQHAQRDLKDLVVLMAGFAFKGIPDTADLRGSVTVDILHILQPLVREIRGYDGVVPPEDLARLGVVPTALEEGLNGADAVIFLNNHPSHTRFNLYRGLEPMPKPALFFDGWHQFNESEILRVPGMIYATLGYQSARTLLSNPN